MKVGSLVATSCEPHTWVPVDGVDSDRPKANEPYTVSGLMDDNEGSYISLEEIPYDHDGEIAWFVKKHFREIQPPMSLEFIEEMQHPLTLLTIEP